MVRLQVASLERSMDYYRGVLGFAVVEESPAGAKPRAAWLGGADGVALVELVERPGASPPPPHARLGLFHYAILLPDRAALGAFLRHLEEVGVRPGASDHLVSEALYLTDPDGLGIEVYADRPRGEWRQRAGQLVMATERLDTGALLRTAEGREWTGMPAGTTIGHVHLHVGHLEAAEAFYHAGLGLDKVVWSYPGALFLSAGGYHHHLGLNTWARGARPAGEDEARLLEWELVVPSAADLDGIHASLERHQHLVERTDDALLTRDAWGTRLRVRAARDA